ncbi:MAG TPA: phosphopantetheine-binding protein [Solimonas sp.]|nr:phosphopantetheine-binding protein [Solimonas sp.]
MTAQSAAEREMAELLVSALNLEHIKPAEVDPAAALFGSHEKGWGLDSIDALEMALAIKQRYNVELRSEDEEVKNGFASLRALTDLVKQRRPA